MNGKAGERYVAYAITDRLRREESKWKLALLHSTRVSHPAGASDMKQFAVRYTAAWCSQDPTRVAAFFAENGSLTINDGSPSVGRAAIAGDARSFMSAFPDTKVEMDGLDHEGERYRRRRAFGSSRSSRVQPIWSRPVMYLHRKYRVLGWTHGCRV